MAQVRIASPCSADWQRMAGDDRIRFCSSCQLNVYNFSAMSAPEVEQLLAENEGRRLCGRFYARADGTLLTEDCPVGLRARVQRVSRWAGAALSTILSVGFAAAQNTVKNPTELVQIQPGEGEVVVTVSDPSGAVIAHAIIWMKNSVTGETLKGNTDAKGRFDSALAPGKYLLRVESYGFRSLEEVIEIQAGDVSKVTASLGVGPVQMGVIDFVEQITVPTESDPTQVPDSLADPISPPTQQNAPAKPPVDKDASTGIIGGVVTDPAGAVIPNATITATSARDGSKFETVSDAEGAYSLPNLPIGTYALTVTYSGFARFHQENVVVRRNKTQTVNAVLTIAVMGEIIAIPQGNAVSRFLHKLSL